MPGASCSPRHAAGWHTTTSLNGQVPTGHSAARTGTTSSHARAPPPIVSHAGERSPMCGRSWHVAAEPCHASVGWPAASTAPPPPGLVLQHACFKMKALVHCTCPSSIKRRSRSLARAHTPSVLHGRRHCELELP
jgi:hypothetical protein